MSIYPRYKEASMTRISITAALFLTLSSPISAFADEPKAAEASNDDALLAPATSTSQVSKSDLEKADLHMKKTRVLIEQKDWATAAEEIRKATELNPNSADAWLIHGTVTMRLEKNAEAKDAFTHYLALNPPADKVKMVNQRLVELEVRLDKEKKIESDKIHAKAAAEEAAAKAEAERYGPEGTGFFMGYSPVYKPQISSASDLNSTISSSFDFGFRIKLLDMGLRYASGTVANITVKDDKNVVLGAYTKGKNSVWDFYVSPYIPLNSVTLGKSGLQVLIPIHLNMFMNNVVFDKTYWNMGFGLGSGCQVRYYTGKMISFDLTGLYDFTFPISAIQNNDATIQSTYNAKGDKIAGKLDGFELRAGITLLF